MIDATNQYTFEYDGQAWLVLSQGGRSYLYQLNALGTYDRVRVGTPFHQRIRETFDVVYLWSDGDNLWHRAQ